jgi:hypothetical protein
MDDNSKSIHFKNLMLFKNLDSDNIYPKKQYF